MMKRNASAHVTENTEWIPQLERTFGEHGRRVFERLSKLSFHTREQADCRRLYANYLLETYAYVRHTSRVLALAASRLKESHTSVRSFLFRHAVAEDRHHHMIVRDLKWLDITAEDAQRYVPSVACQALVGYVYRVAGQGNAVGILGDAYFLENMSLNSADGLADVVMQHCDLPEKAVTFMRNHGKLDVEHVKSLVRVFSAVKEVHDQHAILQTMNVVAHLYADLIGGLDDIDATQAPSLSPLETALA